jgi:hypothetical protein
MNRRDFTKLLPLLVFYLVVVLAARQYVSWPDEDRYLNYAGNLTKGFYAPPNTLDLWSGPGYPLLLVPFVKFGIPLVLAKLLNAVWLFGAVCFCCATLRRYMSARQSLVGAYLLGLYIPFLPEMPALLTESVSIFLVAALSYCVARWFRDRGWRYAILAGFFLGYLALTKVIFGYVIMAGLLFSLVLAKWSPTSRKSLVVCALGMVFCSPYLIYTYHLVGRPLYWSNAGGSCLYWLTNPRSGEYGDWRGDTDVFQREEFASHREFYRRLAPLNYVERDDLFKKQALENVRSHPGKFAFNWAINVARMVFNYPFSYKTQNPGSLFYMFPNAFLLSGLVVSVYPLWRTRKRLPGELTALIVFTLITLAGLSFSVGFARLINPLVPVFVLIIGDVLTNVLRIEWHSTGADVPTA